MSCSNTTILQYQNIVKTIISKQTSNFLLHRIGGIHIKQHILSLSYGKDSLACLGAIEKLGWPLDRIIHAEIWATDTIPADLPPMVEFKKKADKIIKDRWGIDVEHVYARRSDGTKNTYERIFYQTKVQGKYPGNIRGFATRLNPWCTTELKKDAVRCAERSIDKSCSSVSYVGIALDEPKRLARLDGITKISPLAAVGLDEAACKTWCEENDLLSPLYTSSVRGGVLVLSQSANRELSSVEKELSRTVATASQMGSGFAAYVLAGQLYSPRLRPQI